MGRIVIAVYQPKPNKSAELLDLVQVHVERLRGEGLVTDREPIVMTSENGAVLEVFEWLSNEAIDAAHKNPVVAKMWQEFSQVCDYVPISMCPEAAQMFSEFTPVTFSA